MRPVANILLPLLSALFLLAGCGGGDTAELPEAYTVGEESMPALNALVTLDGESQFQQTQDEESGSVTYHYSQLTSGGETAQTYTQALEADCGYTIESDPEGSGSTDFSAPSGQVLAVHETDDPENVLLLTIQWEENSCSVTPALTPASELPQTEPVTLEEAVEHLQGLSTEQLGLPGQTAEYLFVPQDGTVLLDGRSCYCINVYQRQPYQFRQSFLLTLPDLQVYRLDRASGQASPLT